MDFIGEMLDWVLTQLLNFGGIGAEEMKIKGDWINNNVGFQTVWNYFILIGIGMTIVYFLIEINKRWALEGANMTFKNMFAPFLKLIIACVVMMLSSDIFSLLLDFNNHFADWAGTIDFTKSQDSLGNVQEEINKIDFWAKIIMILPILLMFLISILCNLVWIYKAVLYKVELLARVMFAPIALADVYSGNNTNASKYIKGTVALILYGATLVFLPKLTIYITAMDALDFSGNVLDILLSCAKIVISPIAAIGLSSAARQITKEAVG